MSARERHSGSSETKRMFQLKRETPPRLLHLCVGLWVCGCGSVGLCVRVELLYCGARVGLPTIVILLKVIKERRIVAIRQQFIGLLLDELAAARYTKQHLADR